MTTTPGASAPTPHTPIPWGVSSSTMLVALNDPREMPVIGNLMDLMGFSSIGINEARANAAFIVEAVNAHAQQQARIEALEAGLERYLRAEANNTDAVMAWAAAQEDYVSVDPRFQIAKEKYHSAYTELNAAKNAARALLAPKAPTSTPTK